MIARTVSVVDCSPHRAQMFVDEAMRLASVFTHRPVSIHHIGSTAVPCMPAKHTKLDEVSGRAPKAPRRMKPMSGDSVTIGIYRDPERADLVCTKLESVGIAGFVVNVKEGATHEIRVFVNNEDVAAACEALDQESKHGCPECGSLRSEQRPARLREFFRKLSLGGSTGRPQVKSTCLRCGHVWHQRIA